MTRSQEQLTHATVNVNASPLKTMGPTTRERNSAASHGVLRCLRDRGKNIIQKSSEPAINFPNKMRTMRSVKFAAVVSSFKGAPITIPDGPSFEHGGCQERSKPS